MSNSHQTCSVGRMKTAHLPVDLRVARMCLTWTRPLLLFLHLAATRLKDLEACSVDLIFFVSYSFRRWVITRENVPETTQRREWRYVNAHWWNSVVGWTLANIRVFFLDSSTLCFHACCWLFYDAGPQSWRCFHRIANIWYPPIFAFATAVWTWAGWANELMNWPVRVYR